MHKSKRKIKPTTTKIPKPIKIKKEKTEEDRGLHAMSHYIDDRLELVKQIFGTLKPKTIINLAPDFLKKKNMDDIEELCLNELLCISTKRLHSIISASKCPTDTESSSDSDVQRHEEHISLEEISSDSEIEGSSNAGKKKSSGSSAKTGAKKDTINSAEKDKNDGQISVLELLELQARARAIRSQLALEPVTKIEVDSDDQKKSEKAASSELTKDKKRERSERKRKSSERDQESSKTRPSTAKQSKESECIAVATSSSSTLATKANKEANSKEVEKRQSKKIKLKRNYRKPNQDFSEINANDAASKTHDAASTSKEMKRERKSRSPSPDVIPIVAETETLLISDTSDEEGIGKKEPIKVLVMDVIAEKNCEAEEKRRERKLTEPEEGEIVDTEIEKVTEEPLEKKMDESDLGGGVKVTEASPPDVSIEENAKTQPPTAEESTDAAKTASEGNTNAAKLDAPETQPPTTKPIEEEDASRQSNTTENSERAGAKLQIEDSNAASTLEDDDDQNDDIISIEGGDLESEMIEHLEEDSNTKSSLVAASKKDDASSQEHDADIISLDSTDDECAKDNSESWHSRYLKSSKVSKVLITSRLTKRMRDNIKKSKHSKADSEHEAAINQEAANQSSNAFTSKHEDGSIEQYKELLEMRQRKH